MIIGPIHLCSLLQKNGIVCILGVINESVAVLSLELVKHDLSNNHVLCTCFSEALDEDLKVLLAFLDGFGILWLILFHNVIAVDLFSECFTIVDVPAFLAVLAPFVLSTTLESGQEPVILDFFPIGKA